MNNTSSLTNISVNDVAIVVVLYCPFQEDLDHITELATWGVDVYGVINEANTENFWPCIENLHWIKNPTNFGLARALNQGVSSAVAAGSRYILLLDQDSRPTENMLRELVAAAIDLEAKGHSLACVAPLLYDRKAIEDPDAYQEYAVGTTFATSGTLLTRQGWKQAGPMWEKLFIDGIDHEWCFRARAKGLETVLVRSAAMEHDMGEASIKILGRVRPIHRSSFRHYFIVRNTLWLQRKSYIPISWRLTEFFKLAYRIPIYLLTTTDRKKTFVNIIGAILDGVTGRKKRQPL